MAVGAAFNGTSSYIESTTGVDLTHTNLTVGMLAYFTVNTGTRSWLSTGSTTTVRLQPFMDEAQTALEIPGGSFCETTPSPPGISAGAWRLIFISKATGTATPRAHVYDGSTWFDGDLDSTLANASGVIDRITIGCEGQSGGRSKFFSGEIAWVGIWGETTDDATSHTYTNYNTLAAKGNVAFFTGQSLISGGTMADSSANANNETGRSGISAGAQTVPSWFTNFGANLGTLGRATRLVEFVKQVGTVTNTSAATTSAITVAAGGVPVGNSVVIISSADNSGTNGAIQATTISDTRGNTWNYCTHAIADPGLAAAGQEGFIAWANITVALQASDTITISWPASTTAKAARADEFKYMGGLITQNVQNDQTSTTTSVAVDATGIGQLVIGGVAVEGGTADSFTQDADTTLGSWVNPGRIGSGTTTSGATLNPIYKIVTAPGTQTYNPTMGTARDHCAMLAVFACLPYDARRDAGPARRDLRKGIRRR